MSGAGRAEAIAVEMREASKAGDWDQVQRLADELGRAREVTAIVDANCKIAAGIKDGTIRVFPRAK